MYLFFNQVLAINIESLEAEMKITKTVFKLNFTLSNVLQKIIIIYPLTYINFCKWF